MIIWFMNQIQRVNYRIKFRNMFECVQFIANLTYKL